MVLLFFCLFVFVQGAIGFRPESRVDDVDCAYRAVGFANVSEPNGSCGYARLSECGLIVGENQQVA
jgi:hypothetical protein